jgi:uncharacterized protein
VIGETVALVGVAIAAGMLSGLFGVGGGTLFVPALVLLAGLGQLNAEATSLLAIVPVALVGSWLQSRDGAVRWGDAATIGIVSAAGAIAGAAVAETLSGRALRICFACVLTATAIQLAWRALRTPPEAAEPRPPDPPGSPVAR